jgi:transcriptional regulator with XRE-family HTH domain
MYVEQKQHKAYNNSFTRTRLTGAVIRSFRQEHNLSQRELADLVSEVGAPYGISVAPVTISNYENNRFQPKMEITWALCQVMGIDTVRFHGYIEHS